MLDMEILLRVDNFSRLCWEWELLERATFLPGGESYNGFEVEQKDYYDDYYMFMMIIIYYNDQNVLCYMVCFITRE